ncbi:hypothetical protein GIB67_040025 [Kingdonia uniflora]|uniref:CCHC-type domain-containing protein n=1 Tax=Kingdonia uniflora TaxID=39325 RepID=A0A7J7MU96_9MAGN|nr:hypothetical protein GIB67_040025 [Kingdonia uniflora]
MGGRKHEAGTQSEIVCQMYNLEGHIASKCPWVYTKCKKATCNGIMKLMISLTENNYERKFLRCQHSICGSFQWLSDVVNHAKGAEGGSSSSNGYFGCGQSNHWVRDCPWVRFPCTAHGCNHLMKMFTSKTQQSFVQKFLKCEDPICNNFIWLTDA